LVPTLETPQGLLNQSLAVIEWLEEVYPEPSLLPGGAWQRAQIRSVAGQSSPFFRLTETCS
jgi:maleylpyruvate isomerase